MSKEDARDEVLYQFRESDHNIQSASKKQIEADQKRLAEVNEELGVLQQSKNANSKKKAALKDEQNALKESIKNEQAKAKVQKMAFDKVIGFYSSVSYGDPQNNNNNPQPSSTSKVSNIDTASERKKITDSYGISDAEMEYMQKKLKPLEIPVVFDPTKVNLSDLTKDVSKEADELKKLDLSNKILNQKDAEYTQAGLDAISATVSTMGNVVGGAAGSWLQYGAGIVSSVAAALPALAALFPKLMGIAIADSAANAPWFLKIANIAAVSAGVIGAVGAIPKLANGGIAYGNSIVNVGEYQGASANPEVIAPLNKLKSIIGDTGGVSGDVRFRIKGNDLEGILSKNNRKNNRT